MSDPTSGLPARPSLEQLRKQAKDLLKAAREGDEAAKARLSAADTGESVRGHVPNFILADAQRVLAREYGFRNWALLIHHVQRQDRADESSHRPLIRPVELQGIRPYTLPDGARVTTEDVFRMFEAARAGNLARVKAGIARSPGLALVEYNYTPPIHFAVREGHAAIVELLIERGADLGYRSYPFGDALLEMAEDRGHGEVATLLRQRLAQRFAIAAGTRAIIDAARSGDLDGVRAEIARDPGLARGTNETGDTPLHHAAHHGHVHIVQALLDGGADPDPVRGDGYRPIHLALMSNFLTGAPPAERNGVSEMLFAAGARYSMFIAAMRGDVPFIEESLRRDASSVNEEDTCHHRPLSAAARRNDLALVRLLLRHGADPDLPEEGAPHGHALWVAVHDRRYEMAQLLLEHGADPNGMVDSSGTPMMMAMPDPRLRSLLLSHGGTLPDTPRDELGRLLRERRFDEAERLVRGAPSVLEDDGDGILAGPANAGDHDVLAFLIRLGARVPPVSKWAPYYYFKHERTARFLLEHGMDPNHMNWHRFTLLHHMAAEGELAKAMLLVEHGAEVDAIDEEYRSTPLAVAARRGQLRLVEYLLECGADPNRTGAPWATPLAWARVKGHEEIARRLVQAGAS